MQNLKTTRRLLMTAALCAAAFGSVAFDPASAQDKKFKVISIVQPMDNPWVVNNVNFQKAVAEALGIDLTVVADKGTEDSNIAVMQSVVAQHPDGILFDPITQAAGRADAKSLEEAKIPGVTEDRLVVPHVQDYKGNYLVAQVTQNNEQWGYDMMMTLLNEGSKKIVAILDPKGVTTVEEAWKGARRAIEEHPGTSVLQESWQPKSRENAIATMERYLARYAPKEMDGCWCIGSTVGLGALQAIKQAGRQDEVKVSTADDDESVIKAIEDGSLTSTLGGHWMNGGFGLIVLFDHLNGHDPKNRQPLFNLIPVDKTNAAAYSDRFLKGQPFTKDQIRDMSLTFNAKADLPSAMANLQKTWSAK